MNDALRQTGIIVQGHIPWGTHLCLFHQTQRDLLDIMVPYFRAGLENRELCLWVLQPSLTRRQALEALRGGIPDFDRHLTEGSIELLLQDKWYGDSTSTFELTAVVNRFRTKLEEAISRNYVGLRANGSSAWLQAIDPLKFGEYEKTLDQLIADTKMIVICSFSLSESNSTLVLDAARTHQLTGALRDGSWEVIETYEDGRSESSGHLGDIGDGLSNRIGNLAALTPREQAVAAQIVAGASNKEAARILGISPRTIEFHRANIFQKLGARNTADLMRILLAIQPQEFPKSGS